LSAEGYLAAMISVIQEMEAQIGTLKRVGATIGQSVANDGIIHLFGSGHSHMVANEVYIRAGCLTTVKAIWPDGTTARFERTEGLGQPVLKMGDVRAGEVLFVISNSGINPMPTDVALEAKKLGAITVGVGSRKHSVSTPSRHSSGKRLMDVCDYFLDTCVPVGDAMLSLPNLPFKFGPSSTAAGMILVHAALAEAVAWMADHGYMPPVRISRNMPGGDENNAILRDRYRDRLPELNK
jgi:uncharacterized phosphosugar-binding protein